MATMQRVAILLALLAAPILGQPTQQWGSWTIGPGAFGSREWRPPVADEASLPADGNRLGDIRLAVSEGTLWRWDGAEWDPVGGGEGTVSSVALSAPSILSVSGSPVTTTGTLTLSLATQPANTLFAGPTTGADAAPTFRALVSADVPNNAADTSGNAGTATALAANGANCSSGSAPLGVDAAGAAEGCFDVATQVELDALDTTSDDLSDNSITDLSDVTAISGNSTVVVTTTGAQTSGDCVEIDASGNHVASGSACGGGAPSFDTITSGTNTTAAMTMDTGSSLTVQGSATANVIGTAGKLRFFSAAAASLPIELAASSNGILSFYRDGSSIGAASNSYFRWGGSTGSPTLDTSGGFAFWNDLDTSVDYDATTGGVAIIDESTTLIIATTTGDDYVMIRGCKHFGAMAAAPAVTTPSECDEYTDTDDGSGNAAKCVYLDGAWAKVVGAGACS